MKPIINEYLETRVVLSKPKYLGNRPSDGVAITSILPPKPRPAGDVVPTYKL